MLNQRRVFAQIKKPKLEVFLNQCVIKGMNSSSAFIQIPENFAHFYAIAFSFDKEGK
jgi:hypothetical protein